VMARGAMSLVQRETQQVRSLEFLGMTNNPTDMAIIGLKRRAYLLRNVAKAMQMDEDKVVPTDEEIDEVEAAQSESAAQENAEMMKMELDRIQAQGNADAQIEELKGKYSMLEEEMATRRKREELLMKKYEIDMDDRREMRGLSMLPQAYQSARSQTARI